MWLVYAFGSAAFAASIAILGKLGLKNIDSTLATTVRAVIMAVFLIVVSLSLGKFRGFGVESLSSRDWLLIGLSGLAGALSWLCYFAAIKIGNVQSVVAIDKLSVVFAILLAALFLGESLTWKTGLGAALIALGAFFVTLK